MHLAGRVRVPRSAGATGAEDMVGADPQSAAGVVAVPRRRWSLGRRVSDATAAMDVLAAGAEIVVALRGGLAAPAAGRAAERLRTLLGADALGFVDLDGARTWSGGEPDGSVEPLVARVLRTHRRAGH